MDQAFSDASRASQPAVVSRPLPKSFSTWLKALTFATVVIVLVLICVKNILHPKTTAPFPALRILSAGSSRDVQEPKVVFERIPLDYGQSAARHTGFRSIALVSDDEKTLKANVEKNKKQLALLAANELGHQSLDDLDKPGVLDNTRAQLLADVNHVLGGPVVKDLYISIWPPQ